MPLVSVILGVVLLLILMMLFNFSAFTSLIISSLTVGMLEGMTPLEATKAVEKGLGNSAGSLMLVIIFGAAVGKLLTDTGGAQRIAETMVNKFGEKHVQLASVITSIIVGIAMFFETGIVVLIPLVFSIAVVAGVPVLYVGLPVIAALITMHGFVPPHPGATAVAEIFKANIGMTLALGILVAIPSIFLAGVVYTRLLRRFAPKGFLNIRIPKKLYTQKLFREEELPSFTRSIVIAIMPICFILLKTIIDIITPDSKIRIITDFLGSAGPALFITFLIASIVLGITKGKKVKDIGNILQESTANIAMILLIIAGGGAFKEVLIESHIDKYVSGLMANMPLSPLLLTWVIALVLRISLGSATVASMTAASIAAPLVHVAHISPELMTLAAGAGSIGLSHMNDAGFWIVKEYFNMSMKKTFSTWTVLTTIIAVVGLLGVLVLDIFL
ncbi:gluconate permease [Ligilactobacillus salivarius]|uniref:gluconate:H+ symporter n=1 Tax=Ligilactobacillus salivarius TaxID=1624 RepID=UPI000A2D5265|nr:gluconate:H+ symporter [Ligilactobacillus salivarius]OTF90129.1 gluconate permease [Ligilactobacillus salivarius]PAY44069.1 gluconate permease [Ligilactobacillus salivarius]PAY49755.1 gluconate permease [Ligilactobacillus salivarius]PAY58895.1 gluconate permease [Ligilactobacillus salivarius]PAY63635.1 gluconate permease [Ligilactobacillus salivarius]